MRQRRDDAEDDASRLLDTIRWHIGRYDGLRGSVANRASFIISANALLVAGVALVVPQAVAQESDSGFIRAALLGASGLITLGFVGISVVSALAALFGRKSWRRMFGDEPPLALFYHHSDTFAGVSTFPEFSDLLRGRQPAQELESATVALWLGMRVLTHRYASMRRAGRWLQWGLISLVCSVSLAVILALSRG